MHNLRKLQGKGGGRKEAEASETEYEVKREINFVVNLQGHVRKGGKLKQKQPLHYAKPS